MILTDKSIIDAIEKGDIVITPFRKECVGTNSIDVNLSHNLTIYKEEILDVKKRNKAESLVIHEGGLILFPGQLYLGSTVEYTEFHKHVPFCEGKSSLGRLGINIHATAGKGDIGFKGHWTLEISVIKPVRIYPRMPIAQLIVFMPYGEVLQKYCDKKTAKYNNTSELPMSSKMHENFE